MKIALGVDHAAFAYKDVVWQAIVALGHEVVDFGTHGTASVDYPMISLAVARAVRDGQADLGIFLCGTGIGGSIAANKVPGIRAALCHEAYTARMSREHNNANVLCMGARVIGPDLAVEITRAWLISTFSEDDRHARRVRQIAAADQAAPPDDASAC